jgi:hypothetical protein
MLSKKSERIRVNPSSRFSLSGLLCFLGKG